MLRLLLFDKNTTVPKILKFTSTDKFTCNVTLTINFGSLALLVLLLVLDMNIIRYAEHTSGKKLQELS